MQKEYFRIEFSNDFEPLHTVFKKRNIETSVFHNYM